MELKPIQKRGVLMLVSIFAAQALQAADVTLEVLFYDRTGLLGGHRKELQDEVDRIVGAAGVRVKWLPTEESLEVEVACLPLRVTLVEREADYFRLANGVMGATSGKGRGNIFIFYPAILRTLASGSAVPLGPPNLAARLRARAIGRVLVHELVHFLCPNRSHADSGLMRPHWTRQMLVGPGVRLDVASQRAVVQRIAARRTTRCEKRS